MTQYDSFKYSKSLSCPTSRHEGRQAGFTMMEMIIAIAIIGVMSASFVGVKMLSDTSPQADHVLVEDVRLTRLLSLTGGGSHTIARTDVDSYLITDSDGNEVKSEVTLEDAVISDFNCLFNRIGVPTCTGTVPITLVEDGTGTAVDIDMITGYPSAVVSP